jgi:hypothetical protein
VGIYLAVLEVESHVIMSPPPNACLIYYCSRFGDINVVGQTTHDMPLKLSLQALHSKECARAVSECWLRMVVNVDYTKAEQVRRSAMSCTIIDLQLIYL